MAKETFIHTLVDTVPPSAAEFYAAIGHALTQWQFLENGLCNVFEKVSTCRKQKTAIAIFFAEHAFDVKLALVHRAAQSALNAKQLLKWEPLRKRLKDEAEVRNALAHFSVKVIAIGKGIGRSMEVSTEFRLTPNWYDPNNSGKTQGPKWTKEPQSTAQLVRTCARLQKLTADLSQFADETRVR